MHCLHWISTLTFFYLGEEVPHCSLILCVHFQLLLGESECDINEQTGQCEHHPEDSAEGERDRREEEEGKEEEEWKGGERRYFQVPNSSRNVDTCPLEPEHKTCLLVRFYIVWVTVSLVRSQASPVLVLRFVFRYRYWTQTEELKRGRPGNERG